jgi:hypothetical protein
VVENQKYKERRINGRHPVELDAVLNYSSRALICTVRDVSVSGAFIETDPEDLPLVPQVELSVSIPTKEGIRYHRVPVVIRRLTDKGAGVSFGDIDREAYMSLTELVFKE